MIVATNNNGKINEIKAIFRDYEVFSLSDKNIKIEVNEDGNTFEENAVKKAKEVYEISKEPVLADDSGICIDILNGWPGVYTHRFVGENVSDAERNQAIIEKMKNYSERERNASVVCEIAYYDGENLMVERGEIKGKISESRRGKNGFGFDEIFELNDGRTLAELSPEEKNCISARKIALEKLRERLR